MANGRLLEEKAKRILGRGLTVNEVINAGSGCARAAASAIDCACAYQSEMSPPRSEFVSTLAAKYHLPANVVEVIS